MLTLFKDTGDNNSLVLKKKSVIVYHICMRFRNEFHIFWSWNLFKGYILTQVSTVLLVCTNYIAYVKLNNKKIVELSKTFLWSTEFQEL